MQRHTCFTSGAWISINVSRDSHLWDLEFDECFRKAHLLDLEFDECSKESHIRDLEFDECFRESHLRDLEFKALTFQGFAPPGPGIR